MITKFKIFEYKELVDLKFKLNDIVVFKNNKIKNLSLPLYKIIEIDKYDFDNTYNVLNLNHDDDDEYKDMFDIDILWADNDEIRLATQPEIDDYYMKKNIKKYNL